MKTIQLFLTALLTALISHASISMAEDTDLYSGLGGAAGIPNVLMVRDTGANFSSAAASPCTAYGSGGAPSLGDTGGGVEQCALVDAIESLPVGKVNIGLMVNNGNNFTNGAAANVGPCIGENGGCLLKPLTLMDEAGKAALVSFIKTWKLSGNNSSTEFTVKSGGDRTGSNMQEAWAYYTGKIGLSGKNYSANILSNGCQKNFIINIGNSFSNNGGPADTGSSDPNNSSTGLTSAQVAATAAQKLKLSDTITFKAMTCGVTSLAAGSQVSNWSENWADEWARYMHDADGSATLDGTQKITTYTIGVIDNGANSCKPDYPALLTNMANYGGGKYFQTGNASEVKNALLKILNEVQAVNSVFSASSLPVSVNAQGTYLNQIYMGMFRPDETGAPRWLGNIKQYQFVATRDATTHLVNLYLGDSYGNSAISSGGTGFISPNAISYWTCGGNPSVRACSPVPDPTDGFWKNSPQSVGGAYDLPDGELVEKGGAAQMMRLANLTSRDSRNLYTCTGTCVAGASLSSYPFSNSNASLSNGAQFGIIAPLNITSLTRSGGIATVVTAASHGVTNGQVVEISGANESEYNGSFAMTYVSANTLTYPIGVSPITPATGTISANVPTGVTSTITSLTRVGSTVTVTATGSSFISGSSVSISGVTPAAYNGNWTISCAPTPVGSSCGNTFTFTGPSEGPTSPAGGGSAAVSGYTTRTIETSIAKPSAGLTRSGTLVTVTTTAKHLFPSSGTVVISGAPDGYNGTFSFTRTTNTAFTYTLPCITPCSATVLGTATGVSATPLSINLTRTLGTGTSATVTATSTSSFTAAPFSLAIGSSYSISVSGATQSEYNGTFTATVTGAYTFTYPITTSPATTATGTMKLGSSLITADLINWVRGDDNYGDEIGPGGTITVRPSFHGDVLHSRPIALNYGGTTGVVVFYGANDGVYRAVNGNQTVAIGTIPAGSELWGFIPTESFSKLMRQNTNSPVLQMPSTPAGITPTPQKKDYFADGSTSVYQLLNADGTTNKAYIYIAMRRGGNFIYALNVTNPTSPKYLWKITNTGDFTELGQTWSAPKVALIKGYNDGSGNAKPVMIFGAGYSTTQDTEPATNDTMGRGIYIVDADNGALVWRATYGGSTGCSGNATKAACTVSNMNYSIPADITLLDRDNDGYIDRLYGVDVGGNVWRVDLQREGNTTHNTPEYWRVNQVAALGGSGVPLRKFFFPPDVLPTSTFDVLIVGSGDREHPLSSTATRDRIFVLKDLIGNDGSGLTTIHDGQLFDATGILYDDSAPNMGYFKDFDAGEKVVNAPLTVAGFTYYGTNQPSAADSCSANLGIAKGYRLNSLTGEVTYNTYDGGGLPPSPVAGVVEVTVEGETTPTAVPFCIGCGGNPACVGADCDSAVGGGKPPINVPTSRTRTYWYQEVD